MSNVPIQLVHLGVLPRLVLKGPQVADWLRDRSITVPTHILDAAPIVGDAWIVRLGATEFLVDGGAVGELVPQLEAQLSPLPVGVFQVPRSDATFILSGPKVRSVFAQTCAIDFRQAPPQRVVFTRAAGVSCAILPIPSGSRVEYRLWVELSYAAYLWETLAGIVTELGGTASLQSSPAPAVHLTC